MMSDVTDKLDDLETVLRDLSPLAIAVSGGVDSMTLSLVAHRVVGSKATLFHAVSAAVPTEATTRVRHYADQKGWRLVVLEAGEFNDQHYLANPVDRCFYCKTNLYQAILAHKDPQATVLSGANLDDLKDYRPGLQAASNHGVRHPFVEANIDKTTIRHMARYLGLVDVAELPAAPCLSSRVETGIPIQANALGLIHRVERYLSKRLSPQTVRCRLRKTGVVVELDQESLQALSNTDKIDLSAMIQAMCRSAGIEQPFAFEAYRMGSAFLKDQTDD